MVIKVWFSKTGDVLIPVRVLAQVDEEQSAKAIDDYLAQNADALVSMVRSNWEVEWVE